MDVTGSPEGVLIKKPINRGCYTLLCHIERVGVEIARTAKQWVHYQPLRVQYDTKVCNILFIACLTFDVDIQYQLFIVYWSLHGISHLIMLIVCLYLSLCNMQNIAQ